MNCKIHDFIYPPKYIINKSNATTNSYTHPIIKKVFWDRYKTAYEYLKKDLLRSNKSKYNSILEIGTSYGLFLPSLSQISYNLVGSDLESTLEFCKTQTLEDIVKLYDNIQLQAADAKELNKVFDEESFYVILAFSVFEHIDDVESALKSVYISLAQNGVFICEIPTENLLYKLGRKVVGYQDAHEGYNYFSLGKLILEIFVKEKIYYSPYKLPLFQIGVYRRGKMC